MNILEQVNIDRCYNYLDIFKNDDTIKILSLDYRDINFIIGVKGRTEYFRACLKNVFIASKNTALKVRVIVVEQDDNPINKDFCRDYDIDYIFISQKISKCENLHSTSLMYNVGYLFSKEAKYNMFHCCDILIAHNFFDILDKHYLNKSFNWIQPFSEKRVVTMNANTTTKYINGTNSNIDPSTLPKEDFNKPEQPGAPGGCILIPTPLFNRVGGYDPELFYGYTVEDSFFWGKLEAASTDQKVPHIHFGNATYAENPPLYLYHLLHSKLGNHNKDFDKMFGYYEYFFKALDRNGQMAYIDFRKELFKTQKEEFNEIIKTNAIT